MEDVDSLGFGVAALASEASSWARTLCAHVDMERKRGDSLLAVLQSVEERLTEQAEEGGVREEGGGLEWHTLVQQLRAAMVIVAASEARSWVASAPDGPDDREREDLNADKARDKGTAGGTAPECMLFRGEQGTMIASTSALMRRKRRRGVEEETQAAKSPTNSLQPQQEQEGCSDTSAKRDKSTTGGWLGKLFFSSPSSSAAARTAVSASKK